MERPAPTAASLYLEGWKILGWLGSAYLIMSLIDLALGWYPLGFGRPEWEFGTISATIAALAIPTLALYLMLASAIVQGQVRFAQAIAVVMILLAVGLAILALLYLSAVPLALKAVTANAIVHLGMQKAIIKSLTLFTGYEVLYVFGATRGLRQIKPA